MNIFSSFSRFSRLFRHSSPENSIKLSELNAFFDGKYAEGIGNGPDLSEITYFTCLKILSEAVGKLSVHIRDADKNDLTNSDVYRVLNIEPNAFMTPYSFKLLMEYWRNHYGNAYAYCQYNRQGRLEQLIPLNPRNVTIWITDQDFKNQRYFYEYVDEKTGKTFRFLPEEIIHLKGGLSPDGVVGQCVRETLARNMQGNKSSQDFLNNLYQNGLTANAVLKYTGELDRDKKKNLIEEMTNFIGSPADRIIPVPLGMDVQPLDLKLTDSQFAELKKFSSLQIAAAFGVTPNHLNNYEKSSYANSESQELSFYKTTLLPILTGWEEELNRKLLTPSQLQNGVRTKFNVATILRGDLKTQSEALKTYVTGSIYTPNEARKKLDMAPVPNGDVILVNGTYVGLEDVGKAYAGKGGNE